MTEAARPLPVRSVAIVGLGLLGGSLARALRALPDSPWIGATSLDRDGLRRAVEEGVVDRAFDDPRRAAGSAELVVYATPPAVTAALLAEHAGAWEPDAVLTDVASVKGPLLERARMLGIGRRYVGSHPLAGSEERGFGGSSAGLLRGAVVHLVRGDAGEEEAEAVERLWRAVGARPRWTGADEHDRAMVRVSHLPQLVANALAAAIGRSGAGPGDLGPGGRDMTRLAASPPELWREILAPLARKDAEALREVAREIRWLAERLEADDLEAVAAYMERTGRWSEEGSWS